MKKPRLADDWLCSRSIDPDFNEFLDNELQ
jgi:hypothetical protein